jgi:hypothetical protein
MRTNLPRVNFPLRGQIRSDEFTNLFNSIIDEIEAKENDIEQIVDFLSNGFIYGLYCSKDFNKITVETGGYFWKGENNVIDKIEFIITEEPDGTAFVVIDPETKEVDFKSGNLVSDTELLIAQFENDTFTYTCRKKLDDFTLYGTDKRKNIVVEDPESLINLGGPERIAYSTIDKRFHMYGGITKGWYHEEVLIPVIQCRSFGEHPYVIDHTATQATDKREFYFIQSINKELRYKRLYLQLITNAKGSNGSLKLQLNNSEILTVSTNGSVDTPYDDYLTNEAGEFLVIEQSGVHTLSLFVDGDIQVKLFNLYGVV